MPTAEIIVIGTELLLGETIDTNTSFIARKLREVGIDLFHTQIIGDNSARITEAAREAMKRADIVITTGGLGPTVDDPTRQALADAAGVPLEFHPGLWDQITTRITRYGRTPTENQKRQAYIPRGSVAIENPVGTAPAFILEFHSDQGSPQKISGVMISLPGVPGEMETLLVTRVIPYLQMTFHLKETILVRTLHVSGVGEGNLDAQIGDLETLKNPTVGLTAHAGVVDIRIAAKAVSEAKARRMITVVERKLRRKLTENIFGVDDQKLDGVILDILARKGWKLACYEYGLDGGLINRLSSLNNSHFYGGSVIEEESKIKTEENVLKEFRADVCLGIRLYPGDDQQTVKVTILSPLGKVEKELFYGGHPRNAARWAINMGFDLLRRALLRGE